MHFQDFENSLCSGKPEISFCSIPVLLLKVSSINDLAQHGFKLSLSLFSAENIKLLLSHGADVELTNGTGRKPIHVANDEESLKLLLDHGANINATDKVRP
jgi:ankyrin repeat protein